MQFSSQGINNLQKRLWVLEEMGWCASGLFEKIWSIEVEILAGQLGKVEKHSFAKKFVSTDYGWEQ